MADVGQQGDILSAANGLPDRPEKGFPPQTEKTGVSESYISYPLPTFSKIKGFYG